MPARQTIGGHPAFLFLVYQPFLHPTVNPSIPKTQKPRHTPWNCLYPETEPSSFEKKWPNREMDFSRPEKNWLHPETNRPKPEMDFLNREKKWFSSEEESFSHSRSRPRSRNRSSDP